MCPNFELGRQLRFEIDDVVVRALKDANEL